MTKFFLFLILMIGLYADNQTSSITLPLREDSLPYRISIEQAPFSLPAGLQAFVFGRDKNEWLFLSGRTYGLHGFSGDTFPVSSQNTMAYVMDLSTGTISSRSLTDPSAKLTQIVHSLQRVDRFVFV